MEEFQKHSAVKKKKIFFSNKKVEALSFQSCEILKTNKKRTNKEKPRSDRN